MRDRLHWDLATLTLVVPWALVLITAAYVHWLPEIPAYAQGDVAELTSMDLCHSVISQSMRVVSA